MLDGKSVTFLVLVSIAIQTVPNLKSTLKAMVCFFSLHLGRFVLLKILEDQKTGELDSVISVFPVDIQPFLLCSYHLQESVSDYLLQWKLSCCPKDIA